MLLFVFLVGCDCGVDLRLLRFVLRCLSCLCLGFDGSVFDDIRFGFVCFIDIVLFGVDLVYV